MPTKRQSEEFKDDLLGSDLLEVAINWISRKLEPSDVFDEKDLIDWAESMGYVKPEDN